MPDARIEPPETFAAVLARGLAVALGLLAARSALLFAMDFVSHEDELEQVAGRLAAALPRSVVGATFAALVASATASLARRVDANATRRAALALVTVSAGTAFFLFLTGWYDDDHSRRIGLDTARGRGAAWGLGAVGALAALVVASRRAPTERAVGISAMAALLLGLGTLVPAWAVDHGDRMRVERSVASLLAKDDRWTSSRGGLRTAVVTPALDYQLDGSDMPSLVLSPPAEARYDLDPAPGPVRLVARAGIDVSVVMKHAERLAGHAVRFTVSLDGVSLFDERIDVALVDGVRGSEWRDIGGRDGLDVSAGGELALTTTLLDPDGDEVQFEEPLVAGFGGMQLVRSWSIARTRSSPDRPNVVLIVMDTLRRDRVGAYGYERPTTPHVDALAAHGVTFDAAYSTASWTWPSTASILTGMLPEEHGVVGSTSCYLVDELVTLAEALQEQGVTTAAWSGNPLIVPDRNFDQGFEFFESGKAKMRRSRVFVPGALEWLESIAGERFFLYLQLVDPHVPYDPHPGARQLLAPKVPESFGAATLSDVSWRLLGGDGWAEDGTVDLNAVVGPETMAQIDDLYDACVRTGDLWVGRVLDQLEALGLDDETIVIFTSDHGEELFAHGHAAHGQALHEELVRVPLVVAGPGMPSGVRVIAPVSNRHLGPTIARIFGADLPQLVDPIDLFEVIETPSLSSESVQFSTTFGWWKGDHPLSIFGLQRGPLVLHFAPEGGAWGSDARAGDMTLFDIGADPGQRRDLAVERAELAVELRTELLRRIQASEERRLAPAIPAGASTTDMLKGLGYLGDDEED